MADGGVSVEWMELQKLKAKAQAQTSFRTRTSEMRQSEL